jgi:hypothetical protein
LGGTSKQVDIGFFRGLNPFPNNISRYFSTSHINVCHVCISMLDDVCQHVRKGHFTSTQHVPTCRQATFGFDNICQNVRKGHFTSSTPADVCQHVGNQHFGSTILVPSLTWFEDMMPTCWLKCQQHVTPTNTCLSFGPCFSTLQNPTFPAKCLVCIFITSIILVCA